MRLVAVAIATLSAGPALASAVDLDTLALNGSAQVSGGELVLTPDATSQAGSAFIPTPFALTPQTRFSASFAFRIGPAGADGLVFMVQNDLAGASARGGAGGNMGYGNFPGAGIGPSIAVEFDTFDNGASLGDPNGNHMGIDTNGNVVSVATAIPSFSLEAGVTRYAFVDYDGATLTAIVNDTNATTGPNATAISAPFDLDGELGSQGFFGFSAATGALTSRHTVESLHLTVSQIPVPATAPLMVAGLGALAVAARRRRG
ncbi:MAG: L-type lectin-domain containing protein [Paracoccaceae bacterium]|jgi:hypothetical protein|nr:L-type lectin-domain containing protein [Paracoccaceae bacterium]